jgi:hypothetical protein
MYPTREPGLLLHSGFRREWKTAAVAPAAGFERRHVVTLTEYLLLGAVALFVAGFVAVLVWKLWMTPTEYARIKAAARTGEV